MLLVFLKILGAANMISVSNKYFLGFSGKKARLLKLFEGWCDNVIDLLLATDEDSILRRDIYDRAPIFSWGKGRVTLLGDSVHAMQPNLGQGGCMAIEVEFILSISSHYICTSSTQELAIGFAK